MVSLRTFRGPRGNVPMTDTETKLAGNQSKSKRKILFFLLKVGFSLAMLWVIFGKVIGREGADDLWTQLGSMHWGWWFAAVAMQLIAIAFSTVRWQRLLVGQGIRASWRFLAGSIMIARFWGAFTPGGFTGFGGWRIYDVGKHTKKVARATATIGVEMILGQLAFGVVVMAGSIFGFAFIGTEGVLLVNGFFVVLIAAGLLFLSKPALFPFFARFLPTPIQVRVRTLVDAVCAYHGKAGLLTQAALLGMGTHAFNNLIYVCAAHALGVDLSVGMVFFGSSLQIFATLIPASINGIGLRETAAVALYTTVGVAASQAVLIPIVGFAAEMFVSAFGGLIFMLRRADYAPEIVVEDPDREQTRHAEIPVVAESTWPKPRRGLIIGLGAGILAGLLVGLGEAAVVVASGGGRSGLGVLWYGALSYGLFCALLGAGLGLSMAVVGRAMKREAMAENLAYARTTAFLSAFFAFALGAFRIRRDVFHEELVWKSPKGLLVLVGCMVAAAAIYFLLSFALRLLVARKPGSLLLRAWGSPALAALIIALAAAITLTLGNPAEAARGRDRVQPPAAAGNVLFIIVDTLRADRLPGYGYGAGRTPGLDAFAADAIRFDQAFTNSSWTRPSFASYMTGRYPANHGVMSKADALPSEVVTIAEAFGASGFYTSGFVTNYNVAPYFNFQQGFDEYRYFEPEYVLGADDTAAKLLLIQFLRQSIEKAYAQAGRVEPGRAYQDAETVNRGVDAWLDRAPAAPWLLFIGYMDCHDPYFEHPYSGSGYARAAHQTPDLAEAPELGRLYDGEVTYWDHQFGVMVDDLKRRGLYEDLTIVVTADHGEELGDHGGFWHGTTLYDEQVHVPLYVKLPQNRRGGTVVRHWVQSIDVMPTLLAQMGIDVPDGVQGGDLFEGTDVVYAWESHEGNDLESVRERIGTDERKLMLANPQNPRGLPAVQLFHVDTDPGERENLADEGHGEVRSLTETLTAQAERARTGALEHREVELSDDAAQRLRNIGYATDH